MGVAIWIALLFILFIVKKFWKRALEMYHFNKRFDALTKDINGPPGLPLLGVAHKIKWSNVDFGYQLEGWAREFITPSLRGPNPGMVKAKIGPVPLIFLSTHEAIRPILESNVNITKPAQYDIVSSWIGTGLLTSTNEKWAKRRKILTPAFHFNVLADYQEIFARQGEILADMLEKVADTNDYVDCFPFIKRCALDIICEAAMGTDMKIQTGAHMDYVNAVSRLTSIIWSYQRFPWLWFKPIWYLSGIGYEFDRLVKLTNDFTRKVIAERKKAIAERGGIDLDDVGKKKLAFLDVMLATQEVNELTDEDIREEVDTFTFEGHDTTSSGIGFALWYIGQEPDVQRKVHAELDDIFGDSNRLPTSDDIKRMVYLEKCIKESLRMMPSVPLIGRRLAVDTKIGSCTLPKGLTVVIALAMSQRDPRYFEKPGDFYPEHFDQSVSGRPPYTNIPFAAGPRNCIGQKFALLEEKYVLSSVLRRYKLISEHPGQENRPIPELVMKPSRGFSIKFIKRN